MIGVVATTANNLMVNYFMLLWDECVFVAVRINVLFAVSMVRIKALGHLPHSSLIYILIVQYLIDIMIS